MINYFKQWILNRQFVIDSFEEAKKEQIPKIFTTAQKDILETMKDDLDVKAEKLANEKLANLLSVIDMSKIVTLDKFGLIYIGGQKADEVRLANLKAEAEAINQMELWTILHEVPKELSQKAMFVSGESIVDMQKGRSMLYTLASQKGIVDLFRSYVHKK